MYPSLHEALKQAQSQARVRPVEERVEWTKMFIERAKKRVLKAREACARAQATLTEAELQQRKEEDDLADGERRLAALLQEAEATPDVPSFVPPTAPVDFAAELAHLRVSVQQLQRERDELRVQLQSEGRQERERKHLRSLPANTLDLAPLPRVTSAGSTPGQGQATGAQSELMETTQSQVSAVQTDSTRWRDQERKVWVERSPSWGSEELWSFKIFGNQFAGSTVGVG